MQVIAANHGICGLPTHISVLGVTTREQWHDPDTWAMWELTVLRRYRNHIEGTRVVVRLVPRLLSTQIGDESPAISQSGVREKMQMWGMNLAVWIFRVLCRSVRHAGLVHGGPKTLSESLKWAGPWRIILDVVIQIVLLCGSKDPVLLHPGR